MSKIEEMIAKLCPDGVEYKTLGEVGTFERGRRFVKADAVEIGTPCIHYGELYTHYGISATEVKSHINPNLKTKLRYAEKNDVIIVAAGENNIDIGIAVAWLGNYKVAVHDACFIFRHQQNPKYISYFLRSETYHKQIKKYVSEGKICSISAEGISKAIIPVPPIKIQEEIVSILDDYTEKTSELISNLEKELVARKKQYEFYRDQLLSFGKVSPPLTFGTGNEVKWITLGEIALVTKLAGFEFTNYVKYSEQGKIIALRGLNVKSGHLVLDDVKYIDNSDFSKLSRSKLHIGDMLFTYVGTVGQVALIDEDDKYYLAPNVSLIRLQTDAVLPKFMMYFFRTSLFWNQQINKLLQQSSMQNIPMEKIRKFSIPVPSLATQKKIIEILDRFDTLVNDISQGIPAEIEARKKQYEFYRDKLLSFKKAV